MKLRRISLWILITCSLLGTVWLATAQKIVASNPNPASVQKASWEKVDEAARNLRGPDEAPIRALLSQVFAHNGIDQRIVATSGSVPDRLVAAEVAFQSGKSLGITDEKVVFAVNHLAERLHAPDYAYTDSGEVGRLRLKMVAVYPHLIGRGAAATRDDSKPHFDRTMGPIEAFHITATLVFQKIFNPEFQFSSQELKNARQANNRSSSLELAQRVAGGERTREMLNVVRKGVAAMSFRDVLNQTEQSLDELGIPR